MDQIIHLPFPANEPIRSYAPGTPERESLHGALKDIRSVEIEIPLIIGGREVRTGNTAKCLIPHEHGTVLATYHQAGPKEVEAAAEASMAARHDWIRMPWQERLAIFIKAADMLAGPRRDLPAAGERRRHAHQPHLRPRDVDRDGPDRKEALLPRHAR